MWSDSNSNRVMLQSLFMCGPAVGRDGDTAPVLLLCHFNNPEILVVVLSGVHWSHWERRTRQPSLFPVFLEMKLCQRQQCWRDKLLAPSKSRSPQRHIYCGGAVQQTLLVKLAQVTAGGLLQSGSGPLAAVQAQHANCDFYLGIVSSYK